MPQGGVAVIGVRLLFPDADDLDAVVPGAAADVFDGCESCGGAECGQKDRRGDDLLELRHDFSSPLS